MQLRLISIVIVLSLVLGVKPLKVQPFNPNGGYLIGITPEDESSTAKGVSLLTGIQPPGEWAIQGFATTEYDGKIRASAIDTKKKLYYIFYEESIMVANVTSTNQSHSFSKVSDKPIQYPGEFRGLVFQPQFAHGFLYGAACNGAGETYLVSITGSAPHRLDVIGGLGSCLALNGSAMDPFAGLYYTVVSDSNSSTLITVNVSSGAVTHQMVNESVHALAFVGSDQLAALTGDLESNFNVHMITPSTGETVLVGQFPPTATTKIFPNIYNFVANTKEKLVYLDALTEVGSKRGIVIVAMDYTNGKVSVYGSATVTLNWMQWQPGR